MSLAQRIKVLIVHSDPLIRAGLAATLSCQSDIDVHSGDAGGPETTSLCVGSALFFSDVLIADYVSGVELAHALSRDGTLRARLKIIIFTANDKACEIRCALECGVAGYLLSGCPLELFSASVRAVRQGSRYFSPGVTDRLAESMSAEPLTTREEAVLRLVIDGLCNKAIAGRLGVAVGTVKTHLKAVFEKLGVASRTQAVISVAQRGLLGTRAQAAHNSSRSVARARAPELRCEESSSRATQLYEPVTARLLDGINA